MKSIKTISTFILSFFGFLFSYAALTPPATDLYNGGRGVSFNDNWRFRRGDASGAQSKTYNDASWRQLNLPHDWSIEQSFNRTSPASSDGGYLDGGIGWYRKTFDLPASYAGKRITIQFEGVYMNSDTYVNGTKVGNRPYGYNSFQYDITPYVQLGKSNVIAVKVNNTQPSSRWYSGSGIYRNVWLTVTDPLHIAYCGTFVTTPAVSKTSAEISAATTIQNEGTATRVFKVITSVYDQKNNLTASEVSDPITLDANSSKEYKFSKTINNPVFWSLSNPHLYTIRTALVEKDKVVDNFTANFGVRTVRLDPNTGFWLNGENFKLNGVCMHHDLGSLGAAHNYRALERQVEILKSFGCNAIRTSHNPPAPALLDICNRMGVLVLDEAFDCWRQSKKTYDYSNYFDAWARQDIQDFIRRDRNNPCVIMWSIGNEIPEQSNASGYAIASNLMTWIRNDDTTRPITNGMNQGQHYVLGDLLNVVGYNYDPASTYDNDHRNHPRWVILGTETSSAVRTRGVYHLPTNTNILTAPDMQCSSYDNSIVGWGQSAEVSWEQDKTRRFVAGQFIWTGFDYIGEPTPYGWPAKSSYFGIVDMCGFPKDIYYFYQSQWTAKPMVHLLPHWNWNNGTTVPVWAYSNCDSVKLFVNGVSKPAQKMSKTARPYHAEWLVPFVPGKLKAVAYQNGTVVASDSIITASQPMKIHAKADRNTISADGKDVAFIETDILDINNTLVPDASTPVEFTVTGPCKIVGVDNGNPISLESFKGTSRQAFNGKCLAIVQSTGEEGEITVTASTAPVLKNLALFKNATADSEDLYEATNLALNKTASSDSFQPDRPVYLGNDGNTGTRWCAINGNSGHWWMVDLGQNYSITSTEVFWEKDYAYQYIIETSTDNKNWNTVVDKNDNWTSAQLMTDKFTANARYVRITMTGNNPGIWASFYEFRVFDGSTSLSASPKNATQAVDGSENTCWSAANGNTGHHLTVDLGELYNVNQTKTMWADNSGNAYQYKIETSKDNAQWQTVVNKTSSGQTQTENDQFSAVSARYVRVTVTGGTSAGYKAAIAEFGVFDGSTTTFTPSTVSINAVKPPCATCKTDSLSAIPWININDGGWQQKDFAEIKTGDNVKLSTLPVDSTNWKWTGPNGFNANAALINFTNVQKRDSGLYVVSRNNISVKFNLKVTTGGTPIKYTYENAPEIYPNPSKTGIFEIINSENKQLTVYSVDGKRLLSAFIDEKRYKLNLSALGEGTYIVKFKSKDGVSSKRIMIEK